MTTTRPLPLLELLPGDAVHLYLGRRDSIRVAQGCIDLVCHHWLAERVVPMAQRLQADTSYQPTAAGWVQLRALPGAAVQWQKVDAPARTPPGSALSRVLQFLGLARLTLKTAP